MAVDWETGWHFVVRAVTRKLLALDRPALFGTYPDEPPPPPGYVSWQVWFDARGLTPMDFLPLGDPAEGCKLSPVWTRTGEDVCTIGLHFVHADTDHPGACIPITNDDLDNLEGLFTTLWGSIKGQFSADLVLDRYEWHNFGVGRRRPNPKRRETLLAGVAGTVDAALALPPQVATSVTMKTNERRLWGRIFLPAMTTNQLTAGRIEPAAVAAIRTAFGVLADNAAGAHTPLVVWSPRHVGIALKYGVDNHAARLDEPDESSFAKTVDQIQVDDLYDVQRSRRFDRASIKDTHTIGA